MKLQLALDSFLNPNHLPLVAALDQGLFSEAGLEVELLSPTGDGPPDPLAAVAAGEVALACAGPLHMIDEPRPGLRALGCFFETEGGLLILESAMERLAAGETIRLATPALGGLTRSMAVELLRRWFDAHHPRIGIDQVRVLSAGFEHLDNLRSGFDAVWLCYANLELIGAVHDQLDVRFISTSAVGLENFSALELFAHADLMAREPEAIRRFTEAVSTGARRCIEHPIVALELWYRHAAVQPDPVTDAMLEDSCTRLVTPLLRDRERWRALQGQCDALGVAQLTRSEFDALYD